MLVLSMQTKLIVSNNELICETVGDYFLKQAVAQTKWCHVA